MTEPSKWSLKAAQTVCEQICDYGSRGAPKEIALALDAARRQALEEAARVIECGEPAGARYYYKGLIHSLIDREPTP